ncbi:MULTISPECIES: sensor histidine kinase [Bacteroides]|uniref:sensor histidine kinase n=1 Tax=Bacteroides TaxID=816 RepID=UPI000E445472|nr:MULTISPECIES: HAMP domain-containing sensor histidine kinase [Bacteroides]RGM48054.1 sensor histidine kinase [Bacteroides sp. OM08-11]
MFREDSLCAVLSEIAKAQEMNMREGVKMLLELPERDISIYTDPARLGQVVNNLINTAVKFTQKGSISLGCNLLDDGKVEIYVRDTGTGMSGEVLSHIFERFFKGDAFVQGTGLGLAICRTIVERFHRKINAVSKEGEGSCFTITLPLQTV